MHLASGRDKGGAGFCVNLILLGLSRLMSRSTQPVECFELACTEQHTTWIYKYILACIRFSIVHTHDSTVSKSTRQNITDILDSVFWRLSMAVKDSESQSPRLAWHIQITARKRNTFHLIHFKFQVLVALEHWIFNNLQHNIFQVSSPQVDILVLISCALPHVEALDVAIMAYLIHSLVQSRIFVLRIEFRISQHSCCHCHSNSLFELFYRPCWQQP